MTSERIFITIMAVMTVVVVITMVWMIVVILVMIIKMIMAVMMMIQIMMVRLTYDNAGAICEKGSVTKMTSSERE